MALSIMSLFQRKRSIAPILLWLIITLIYCDVFNILQPIRKLSSQYLRRKPPVPYTENATYILNLTNCFIPNFAITIKFKESKNLKQSCDDPVVFVEKISNDEIILKVDYDKIRAKVPKKKDKKDIQIVCSYQFAARSNKTGKEDTQLRYTSHKPFNNGTTAKLEEEFLVTKCKVMSSKNIQLIADIKDAFLILKKKTVHKLNDAIGEKKWNVLVVGMDTVSRARAFHSMPKMVHFLQAHDWLDYRGYNKVGLNTFPNLMAFLAGKNATTAYAACANGMDAVNQDMIWSKFKEAGYVTAYGEENLALPDTFSPYHGFTIPPTDHYARPFFLIGEKQCGNIVCTGSKPSAVHLLEYALQFAQSYKNDSFFGFFWINSYSHSLQHLPNLFEHKIIEFFEGLNGSHILENTFVFLLSDHGKRYGEFRLQRESFYEARLPMLFIWVPHEFRRTYPQMYYNLQLNQDRLTTHYDLHSTFGKIMKVTNKNDSTIQPEPCPHCKSLTEEVLENRTCKEANIDEKWCACHDMTPAEDDPVGKRSVEVVAAYVLNKTLSIETIKCTTCLPLKLKNVIRIDRYVKDMKTYYIVAMRFSPQDVMFETTVEYHENNFTILHPTDTISSYHNRGYCTVLKSIRGYCVCAKKPHCK